MPDLPPSDVHEEPSPIAKPHWAIWAGALIVFGVVATLAAVALTQRAEIRNLSQTQPMQTFGQSGQSTKSSASQDAKASPDSQVSWQQTENGWQAVGGTPPDCPTPLFTAPADLSLVTSVLYPGQTRGGNYKPHGGFRFDTITDNQVTVRAPQDAVIVDGGRYLVGGETQYTFDLITPCGYMYRVGHFLTLDPKYQALADTFPPAAEGDSRTTFVNPPLPVKKGEIMATAVGIKAGQNTFFDWGVYNVREKNAAAKDPAWAASHDPSLAPYAVCWFDLLPADQEELIRSLPAGDPTSGKTSDYCR